MAPNLIFIRHGQAEHNVSRNRHLFDPPLTRLGVQQCEELGSHLKTLVQKLGNVSLIITSPLRRALQTTSISLKWLIEEKNITVQVREDWQEITEMPCDMGSSKDRLKEEYEYDFTALGDSYPSKSGRYAYTKEAVEARGQACIDWLRLRPEKVIVVVTHDGFLRTAICHRKFANADYRIFTFNQQNRLDESPMTAKQNGGMGRSIPDGYVGWLKSDSIT